MVITELDLSFGVQLFHTGENSEEAETHHCGPESTDFGAELYYRPWGKERIFYSQSGHGWALRCLIGSQLCVTEGVAAKRMLLDFLNLSIITLELWFYFLGRFFSTVMMIHWLWLWSQIKPLLTVWPWAIHLIFLSCSVVFALSTELIMPSTQIHSED